MSRESDLTSERASGGISAGWLSLIIISVVLIADQAMKIWVKTHFYLGEDLPLTSWWHLKFIENNGMAFGMELTSKIVLTFVRIFAVGFLIWIISRIRKNKTLSRGFIISVALIAAGAAGNIFDCVFYGVVFNNPMPPELAQAFPIGGGYSTWFEGRVVDMLYFPLFDFQWPLWMPFVGGSQFEFFSYIFNIADSAICVGVFMLILFYSGDVSKAYAMFKSESNDKKKEK